MYGAAMLPSCRLLLAAALLLCASAWFSWCAGACIDGAGCRDEGQWLTGTGIEGPRHVSGETGDHEDYPPTIRMLLRSRDPSDIRRGLDQVRVRRFWPGCTRLS